MAAVGHCICCFLQSSAAAKCSISEFPHLGLNRDTMQALQLRRHIRVQAQTTTQGHRILDCQQGDEFKSRLAIREWKTFQAHPPAYLSFHRLPQVPGAQPQLHYQKRSGKIESTYRPSPHDCPSLYFLFHIVHRYLS